MLLKQLCNCISSHCSQVGWHTLIRKLLGHTKETKTTLTMGLGIMMTKSLKTLRMTTLMERVLRAGLSQGGEGGTINSPFARFRKSCFRKDSQVRNACIFASFRKYAFSEILRFSKLSQI